MSDGTLNFPKRITPPATPAINRYKIYVDGTDDEVKYIDDLGVIRTFKGIQGIQGNDGVDGVDGVDGAQGVQGIQGIQGIQGPQGAMTVEALISETALVTLPNTATKTIVYSDPITITSTGACYLDISLAIKPHNASNDMEFDLQFDGVTLSPTYAEEHKDISAAQSMWRSQCIDLGIVTAGTYNLDLRFSKEVTGGTAKLKNYTAKVVRY